MRRDRDIVALGWDAHLAGFASTMLNWARSVTVVTNGHHFDGDESCRSLLVSHDIKLVEEDAVRLLGARGSMEGLCLQSGRLLTTSLVFFSIAHEPRTELATSLGCRLDEAG